VSTICRRAEGIDGEVRILFWCPGCDAPHAPRVDGGGTSWEWNGDMDRPTFTPSILVNKPGPYHARQLPTCHSFVRDGRISFLTDCTHELAGRVVDLPAFDGPAKRRNPGHNQPEYRTKH